jgi:two-component system, OmpR family, KDP operon response regulator KdpE
MNKGEILIIDDEPQIRKLLRIVLESNDYKVAQAATGNEGIHLAANHSPELVLLDLGLPDMSGHEVLLELRTWFEKSIIILSVQDSEEDIIKALDNGATDYLIKPFRTGELLARIRSSIRINQDKEINPIIESGDIKIDLTRKTCHPK